MTNTIKSLVIVGNSIESWTVALAIAKAFDQSTLEITHINHKSQDIELPLLSPQAVEFHKALELDERDLMRATDATFTLGSYYHNWNKKGHHFFLPFSPNGSNIDYIGFQHFAIKNYKQDPSIRYDEYSFPAIVAKNNKFTHPDNKPRSILSSLTYSINLDPSKYKDYLRKHAQNLGVQEKSNTVDQVNICAQSGKIESVTLDNNNIIEADFFIDCSGTESLLIGGTLNIEWENWSKWLPHDKKVLFNKELPSIDKPQTSISNEGKIICREASSQNIQYVEAYYNSDEISESEVIKEFQDTRLYKVLSKSRNTSSGQRTVHWHKNCIGFGAAVSDFPSIAISNTQVVQESVMRFIELFPTKVSSDLLATEYNQLTKTRHNNIRDYSIAHFLFSDDNTNSAFSNSELPEVLKQKLSLFNSQGKLSFVEEEQFPHHQWVSLLLGQNQWPENYDLCIDSFNFEEMKDNFINMRSAFQQGVTQMPSHSEYLAMGLSL